MTFTLGVLVNGFKVVDLKLGDSLFRNGEGDDVVKKESVNFKLTLGVLVGDKRFRVVDLKVTVMS